MNYHLEELQKRSTLPDQPRVLFKPWKDSSCQVEGIILQYSIDQEGTWYYIFWNSRSFVRHQSEIEERR